MAYQIYKTSKGMFGGTEETVVGEYSTEAEAFIHLTPELIVQGFFIRRV